MGLDRMCSILAQAPMALLVVKEQIGSAQAIYLHVFQLPKNRVALQYVHDHPRIPGECGRMGPTRQSAIVTSSIMAYSSAGVSSFPSPTPASTLNSPCTENCGASFSNMYSPWSSGEYISPESSCLLESITGTQQLILVIYKFNLLSP